MVGRTEAALFDDLDGVEIITHDKQSGARGLRQQLKGREFDALLLMQVALRAGLASRAVRAPVRLGFDRSRARDGHGLWINQRIAADGPGHVIDGFFGFARALGINERVMRWDIPIPTASAEQAARYANGQPSLVISPCSSQRKRNYRDWPVARYIDVARHAAQTHGLRIVITGAGHAKEMDYAEAMVRELKAQGVTSVVNVVGRTDVKTLFALIAQASAVIAPDSGPVHMAVAAGTPVIGLYAGSNPERTGPVCGQQWVVNAYPKAVRQAFGCAVEQVRWGRRVRTPDVMDWITSAQVIERLDTLLATPKAERLAQ